MAKSLQTRADETAHEILERHTRIAAEDRETHFTNRHFKTPTCKVCDEEVRRGVRVCEECRHADDSESYWNRLWKK